MIYPLIWLVVSSLKPNDEIFTDIGTLRQRPQLRQLRLRLDLAAAAVRRLPRQLDDPRDRSDHRQSRVVLARGLRVRTAAVPRTQSVLRDHAGHDHAALPRRAGPAVHHLPGSSAGSRRSCRSSCRSSSPLDAFFIFLMVQFIRGIPKEIFEAARIDGAGHGRIFAQVTLPLMVPALATTAIFTFIWTWSDFFGPLHLSAHPRACSRCPSRSRGSSTRSPRRTTGRCSRCRWSR